MILIISAIATPVIIFIGAKKIFIQILKIRYERALLKGDRHKAIQFGNSYYLCLKDAVRNAKGIINIDTKITDDFNSFNNFRFSII